MARTSTASRADNDVAKKTRTRRSPQEKVLADLDKAQRSLDKANEKLAKLNEQIDDAEADVNRAQRLVDFLSQNPDLPEEDDITPGGTAFEPEDELQPA